MMGKSVFPVRSLLLMALIGAGANAYAVEDGAATAAATQPAATEQIEQAAPTAPVKVHSAWARELPANSKNGVVYMSIDNNTATGDKLLSAETPVADKVMFCDEGEHKGMHMMQPLAEVSIGAGQNIQFTPGGRHVMLMGLKSPLEAGQSFPLTLHFRHSGDVTTDVSVVKHALLSTDQGTEHHQRHHHHHD